MSKSFVDIIKSLQILYNRYHAGCELTLDEKEFIESYIKAIDKSPKDFALMNNTADLKPSDLVEIINL